MGTLKPGSIYIYERNNGTIYAREAGADPSTRQVVGYEHTSPNDSMYEGIANKYFLEVEWADILKESQNNLTLQEAIERVKIIYHLIILR